MNLAPRLVTRLLCCSLVAGCSASSTGEAADGGGPDSGLDAALDPQSEQSASDHASSADPDDDPAPGSAPDDVGSETEILTDEVTEPKDAEAMEEAQTDGGVPVGESDGDSEPTLPGQLDAAAPELTDGGVPSTPTEPTFDPPTGPAPNALFDPDAIARFQLTVGDAGVEALRADPFTYVEGDVEVELADGTLYSLPSVGVRQKGRVGSRRDLDDKPSFLIKTNEYVKGQELLGMKKVALNNMVQDPSSIHEQLSYDLFRSLGVPAPRTSYARVRFNGSPVALYASVEVIDNKHFLEGWFGNEDGTLYEGEYGADLDLSLLDLFDLDRGTDVAYADLAELATALDAMTNGDTLLDEIAPFIDMDRYVRFVAIERVLAHWDGYAEGQNNYFLYRTPTGPWTFIPWGTDQTFGWYEAPIWLMPARLQALCEQSQPCRLRLGEAYAEVLAKIDELDLLGRCDALQTLIYDAANEDLLKEQSIDEMLAAIEEAREFLRQRAANVDSQLECVDVNAKDVDGDGAHGCGEDCNDQDPLTYPGAPERCNQLDDNCDGVRDEDPMCPHCTELEDGGERYAFCYVPTGWLQARDQCVQLGGVLASVHEPSKALALREAAASVTGGDWWIGLNDLEEEGVFVWEDQSNLDFQFWSETEPNNAGDGEHCGHMNYDGRWNDLGCEAQLNYICRLP